MLRPPENAAILIVDDEADFARGLARLAQKCEPRRPVAVCASAEEALARLRKEPAAMLLTDLRMPGMTGLELLEQALALDPGLSVVVLTGYGSIETAVQALKAGAYDFLTKPIDQDALFRTVRKALERAALLAENRRLRETCGRPEARNVIVGDSPAVRRLREEIESVAATDYTVLIRGESGAGKELVARTIHRLSRRADAPLVTINCPAIPDHLLESELFGHVKGAFTGADKPSQGLFLAAHTGSLLLDEIGDMPVNIQPKLLRVLQEKEVRPVGGSESRSVDVRILASTNRMLEQRMAQGHFREDLYYRINVLTLRVPALAERREDVPLLAMHFLRETCREMDVPAKEFAPEALDWLAGRPWPGNVRELQNFVRRLAVFTRGERISVSQVRLAELRPGGAMGGTGALGLYKEAKERFVEDFTLTYVQRLLEENGGNISQAARVSGLERVSLQKIVRRLGIDAEEFRGREE